jgi:hypothetical protein
MTAVDHGFFTTLYVTNVLNGTVAAGTDRVTGLGNVVNHGTVVRIQLLSIPRIRPVVFDEDAIATGFPERTDPDALVIGPIGSPWPLTARHTWPTPSGIGSRRSPMRRSASSRSATVDWRSRPAAI